MGSINSTLPYSVVDCDKEEIVAVRIEHVLVDLEHKIVDTTPKVLASSRVGDDEDDDQPSDCC